MRLPTNPKWKPRRLVPAKSLMAFSEMIPLRAIDWEYSQEGARFSPRRPSSIGSCVSEDTTVEDTTQAIVSAYEETAHVFTQMYVQSPGSPPSVFRTTWILHRICLKKQKNTLRLAKKKCSSWTKWTKKTKTSNGLLVITNLWSICISKKRAVKIYGTE